MCVLVELSRQLEDLDWRVLSELRKSAVSMYHFFYSQIEFYCEQICLYTVLINNNKKITAV